MSERFTPYKAERIEIPHNYTLNKILFDGSRPRVAVKTEKRFKDFLKSYKKVLCTQTYIEDNTEYWTEGKKYNACHQEDRWLIETNFGEIGFVGKAYMLDDFEAYFELCKEVK